MRDESVIGQILTCPKCGSMVLVEPVAAPNKVSPAVDHTATQNAVATQDSAGSKDFEDAAGLFDEFNEPPPTASPDLTETVEDLALKAESRRRPSEAELAPAVVHGWKNEPEATDESDDEVDSEFSPPPLPADDSVLLPNADWASASTIQWRNRVLMGIAAVVGVILALMLLIVFSGTGETPTIVSAPATMPPAPPDDDDDVPAVVEAIESTEEVDNIDVPPATPRDTAPDDADRSPVEGPIEPPAPIAVTPDPAPLAPAPVAADPEIDEPPGLTPKESVADAAASDAASPLAETLREFGELLEKTADSVKPMPEVDSELPPEPGAGDKDEEPIARRTGPRVVELAERLNDPVLQIEFESIPLVNFLQFVSEYSTIPITLDADAVRWMPISPITPVKLKAADTTIAEMLKQGISPLGLEYRIEADQLFITRRPKNESGVREVVFKVDDLVGNDAEQLQQIGARIMDFASPDSWSSRGGIGTMTFRGSELIVEQYESVQFEILEFCEKLRVARGLDKLGPYDAKMFRLETRGERARAKLAQAITLTYLRPAPFDRIVDRIAQAAKLHILIDWRALAEEGWSPDAKVRFSVADQPLSKALSTLLEPMDLAVRVIDESTLQITSPAVLDSRLEIEFYRVPELDGDGASLVQSARDALGPANFRDGGGSGQLAYDKPSNCLLANLSQPRQLELQTWLATRGDSTPSAASRETTTPTATVGNR